MSMAGSLDIGTVPGGHDLPLPHFFLNAMNLMMICTTRHETLFLPNFPFSPSYPPFDFYSTPGVNERKKYKDAKSIQGHWWLCYLIYHTLQHSTFRVSTKKKAGEKLRNAPPKILLAFNIAVF
jgi:hypothetical protein